MLPTPRYRCCFLALAVALVASAVVTREAGAEDKLAAVAFHHPAERVGDYDRVALDCLAAIPAHLEDTRCELLASRAHFLQGLVKKPSALLSPVEGLLANPAVKGSMRTSLLSMLEKELQRRGRFEDARKVAAKQGTVRHFLVIGPFGKDRVAPLGIPFPPESELDVDETYRDGWQTLEWRNVPIDSHRLLLSEYVSPSRGVSYALAQVEVKSATDVLVEIVTGNEIRAWHNHRLIVDDTVREDHVDQFRRVPVRLEEGFNRLLIKTASSFSLRITDLDGTPLSSDALTVATSGDVEPQSSRESQPLDTEVVSEASPWEKRLAAYSEKEGVPPLDVALARSALAQIYQSLGRSDLAVEQVTLAMTETPEDPWILSIAGDVISRASYLPAAQAKSRAKNAWGAAVAADEGFLPARAQLASQLLRDQKHDEALTAYQSIVKASPIYLGAQRSLHSAYRGRGWNVEARRVLETIAKIAPELAFPELTEARRYEQLESYEKAEKLYATSFEKDPRQISILESLASFASNRGDHERAEKLLRKRLEHTPQSTTGHLLVAGQLLARGDQAGAIALLDKHAKERPWDIAAVSAYAGLVQRMRGDEAALPAYRQLLAMQPGNRALREFVARFDRATAEYWKPYDEKLEDWLDRVPTSGPLIGTSSALCVLDITVVEIYDDNSSSSYTHQAFQLLTEEAKDEVAKVQTAGEILALRTLTPQGESLEPVAALEGGQYIMPGMKPGVFTEYAYRIDDESRQGAAYTQGSFYFQDFSYKQTFLLSRMVFIVPPAMASDVIEKRLSGHAEATGIVSVKKTEKQLEDGRRVITYESNAAARVEPERAMPPSREYIPSIEVQRKRSWRDVTETLRMSVRRSTLPTPELEKAAREATEGLEDPLEKAKALYKFVHDLVAQERGSRIATRVLLEKSGDRTNVYKALLDAAGVPSAWAFASPKAGLLPEQNWAYPSTSLFPSRFIVLDQPGASPIWVTMRYRHSPFGRLPESFNAGRALVLRSGSAEFVSMPSVPADDFASTLTGKLKLGDSTEVDVEFSMVTRILQAYLAKDQFKNIPTFQRGLLLQSQARRMFPGAKVTKAAFGGEDDPNTPLELQFKLSAPNLLAQSGQDFLLPVVVQPSSLVRSYGAPPDRKHPYVLRLQRVNYDSLLVELGESFELARLPEGVALAGKFFTYSLSFREEEGGIRVDRRLEIRPGRLEPDEFPAFLKLLQDADNAEKERIVLRKIKRS